MLTSLLDVTPRTLDALSGATRARIALGCIHAALVGCGTIAVKPAHTGVATVVGTRVCVAVDAAAVVSQVVSPGSCVYKQLGHTRGGRVRGGSGGEALVYTWCHVRGGPRGFECPLSVPLQLGVERSCVLSLEHCVVGEGAEPTISCHLKCTLSDHTRH